MTNRQPIKRAIVSVFDKTGIVELGLALQQAGVEIVSTGSTAKQLQAAGVTVIAVEDVTGFPECLDDRVKTLHPKIHGGLLGDRRKATHVEEMRQLGIQPFDVLISNLYPFSETVATGADFEDCIAKIDIGGPAMVRASAKNHASVAVITSPEQYPQLLNALIEGGFTLEERTQLAATAFRHTATYDVAVASWLGQHTDEAFPQWLGRTWTKTATLRYGENSHQQAALYRDANTAGLATAHQHGGKEMSYNNYVDTNAAMRASYDFDQPCVAIMKHNNPCGLATGADIAEAHRMAHECDPVSAYGGVIAANREVTLAMAEQVKPIFTEVIVAPSYEPAALELLQKKKNLRILSCSKQENSPVELREIDGGILLQQPDHFQADGDRVENWVLAAGEPADEKTLAELEFAWRACRSVKSNAILLAQGTASVGIGMGQVNRVDCCHLAVSRAGERTKGAVAASDAYFPFADGLMVLIEAGVRAVVQPGGSIRDEEAIAAAKQAGITMYFTGTRHFFH